jgi:hypothetical protein
MTSYARYLDATDEASQRAVVDEPGADTFVHLSGSKWVNLQISEGRQSALCHVLSLVPWHDGRQASDNEEEEPRVRVKT